MAAAAVEGNRKGMLILCSFMVLYLTLFQMEIVHCWPEGPFLPRALRSIPSPDYQTIAPLQLNVTSYGPEVPYLGTLSDHLKIGSVIRIHGYVPPNTKQFQFNLCTDCSKGPIHLHIDVRIHQGVVVRNSYADRWGTEDRDGRVHFAQNQEFVAVIEVRDDGYHIIVNGDESWTFEHRVPYSTVEKFDIKGEPLRIWKIEYTEVAFQEITQGLHLNGEVTEGMTVHLSENPSAVIEKFTLDLRCECTPQNSSPSELPMAE